MVDISEGVRSWWWLCLFYQGGPWWTAETETWSEKVWVCCHFDSWELWEKLDEICKRSEQSSKWWKISFSLNWHLSWTNESMKHKFPSVGHSSGVQREMFYKWPHGGATCSKMSLMSLLQIKFIHSYWLQLFGRQFEMKITDLMCKDLHFTPNFTEKNMNITDIFIVMFTVNVLTELLNLHLDKHQMQLEWSLTLNLVKILT